MNKTVAVVAAVARCRRRRRGRLLVRHAASPRRRRRPGAPGAGARPRAAAVRGAAGPPAVTVEAITVATAPMPQTITAVGSLRSDESVTLRPEVAGRISAIRFQEGQRVAKGAPLVKLDPAVTEAEVAAGAARTSRSRRPSTTARSTSPSSNFISGQAKDEAENNLQGRRGGAAARRGEAREDGDPRAVLRHHRPALGVGRRLREGRRRTSSTSSRSIR